MDYVIKIMAPAERNYCYTDSQQLDKQTGCIGHLRGDMDKSGNGFFTSWEDHCGELKTQAFKDEFDDFINALRFDERYDGIFKNRSNLSRYCYEHKESVFAEDFIPQYGFRVDAPEYAYLLRLNPMQGDYNLYIYCYRREMLDQHMEKAARGICFLDTSGKERFRIPDGDSIRVTRPDGSHSDHTCRYIDENRVEIGYGVDNLYHMAQFAEWMARNGNTYLYQLVESKQRFIAQIMTSKAPARAAEDVDETALSYAEIKALATGNPQIIEKCNLDMEVSKLNMLRASHLSQRYALEKLVLRKYPAEIKELNERIAGYEQDSTHLAEHPKPAEGIAPMVLGGVIYTERENAGKAIIEACTHMNGAETVSIGSYRGFSMLLSYDGAANARRLCV